MCHSRKSTGGANNINYGSISLRWNKHNTKALLLEHLNFLKIEKNLEKLIFITVIDSESTLMGKNHVLNLDYRNNKKGFCIDFF